MLSLLLLGAIILIAYKLAPRERKDHQVKYGAGQVLLLAAIALFGVDYFTSFFYATGELMSALHPLGLQRYAYIAVAVIAFANFVLGALYIYSLGVFNEGGGSFTASMRYLWPFLSVVVAVTLVQDYVLTIVVSSLSGADQLLSILSAYGGNWLWHFAIGALLAVGTWYLTLRGRGESARVVFTLLGAFVLLSVVMGVGLLSATAHHVAPAADEGTSHDPVPLGVALFHILVASMKGMVALTGLEAVSNGIQFMADEDSAPVRLGKKYLPRLRGLWDFYSGKAGIARVVQTSFLFYGGLTTLFLTYFSIKFNVFDGTLGRTLVGNLAYIGFGQLPSGFILYWAYQILAVLLLAAAAMTAYQDVQAIEWRSVAIGVAPEVVVKRDAKGTFLRSVTFTFGAAVLIMFLVRGHTPTAIPFYGISVFMPITVMGLAIRRHILENSTGMRRFIGSLAAAFATMTAAFIFVMQVVAKWHEGGWVALLSFGVLAIATHLLLFSSLGKREPAQILRIVRQKARVLGKTAKIVEWQAFRMQLYRLRLFVMFHRLLGRMGLRKLRVPGPTVGAISGDMSTEVSMALYNLYDSYAETPENELEEEMFTLRHLSPTMDFCVLSPVQVPGDGETLCSLGIPIARARKGEVFVTHIVKVTRHTPVESMKAELKGAMSLLRAVINPCKEQRIHADACLRLGPSFQGGVESIAREVNANLVLVRAHRHPDRASGLFGPTIDPLLHNPVCDLALFYCEKDFRPVRRILVPTDASEHCRLAAQIASDIARGSAIPVMIDALHVQRERPGDEVIDKTFAGLEQPTRRIVLKDTDVAEAIIKRAVKYDLVVIGATRERGMQHLLAGVITEKVARRCPVPYVIARRMSPLPKALLKSTFLRVIGAETPNPAGVGQ